MALITSGLNADTLGSLVSGPGFATTGLVTAASPIGTTEGGWTFDAGRSLSRPALDGLGGTAVRGIEYVVSWAPTLSATMKQFKRADLTRYFGSAFVGTAPAPRIMTPVDANKYLTGANYLDEFRFWMKRADGMWIAIYFPSALPVPGASRAAMSRSASRSTYEARLVLNETFTNGDDAPFRIEEHDTAPTLAVA